MSSSADNIPIILQQIETCLRLAQQCNDDEIADHLLALARAFVQRAIERGADTALIPNFGYLLEEPPRRLQSPPLRWDAARKPEAPRNYGLIEKEGTAGIIVDTAHLASKHIEELGQAIDARLTEQPPQSGEGCIDSQSASPRRRGAKFEGRQSLSLRSKVLGSDEDRASAVAFDSDSDDGHQRQRDGNKHTREHGLT